MAGFDTTILLLLILVAGVIIVWGIVLLRSQAVEDDQLEKIRLLVVDSNANARETLTKFLRFENVLDVVGKASTGKAALKKARQFNPTVVLLDISLADMEGLAVAEAIKRELPGMRFVFIRDSLEAEPENWPPGWPTPLVKPLDYRELVKAIKQAERYG